jgi:hypothetical protein
VSPSTLLAGEAMTGSFRKVSRIEAVFSLFSRSAMLQRMLDTAAETIATMAILGAFLGTFWVINNLPSIAKSWNAWRKGK